MPMHNMWLHHMHTKRKDKNKKIRNKAEKLAKSLAHEMLEKQLKKIWYKTTISNKTTLQIMMDKIIYIIALLWPILTIPQIWNIWVEKNASWLSLFTWWAYLASAILWLTYWIIHKEKAIIFANILWTIVNTIVIIWTIIYW